MTLSEFNELAKDQKITILWAEGNFISDRKLRTFSIVLYQLFSFYVEVWYESNLNEIDILCAFNNTAQLEPYLDKIDISWTNTLAGK